MKVSTNHIDGYARALLDIVAAEGDAERREWMRSAAQKRIAPLADRFRDRLIATYGAERGGAMRLIEAIEIGEYGSPLTDESRKRIFPFLP